MFHLKRFLSSFHQTNLFQVSYLEIYNERVKDLLRTSSNPSSSNANSEHNLKVREHPRNGPYVENLSKHLVMDYPDICELMRKGNDVRTTAATNMNDTSSRSHAIFTITFVNAGFLQGVPHETVSKIHLVDLAGSERADATGSTGQRLKEGAHINKSLVTLGSVISALAEASNKKLKEDRNVSSSATSSKQTFIPYRDSVLTWLLKDSLGGNSKTIMIATISPADVNHGETLSTLRYANRAKNIINKPTVNEDPNVKIIRELRHEIDRLKSMMSLDPIQLTNVQRQLAVKEAQERHLTEEWTEKWKEAANILKEQRALALKRTGLGVVLDSDQPHLVGIDEDVLSTGITLYHLKEGNTVIGSMNVSEGEVDIGLKGPSIEDVHCTINVKGDGEAYLIPSEGALCMVNASLVDEPTKLSQGCVIVLGKTNMFRYNDPKEAEKLRKNVNGDGEVAHGGVPEKMLLSQSLSDLRHSADSLRKKKREMLESKLHSSDGDILKEDHEAHFGNNQAVVTTTTGSNEEDTVNNNNYDESYEVSSSSTKDVDEILSAMSMSGSGSTMFEPPMAKLTSHMTSTPAHISNSAVAASAEAKAVYNDIIEQKNVIISCLESEQCDIDTLNKEIDKLKGMQDEYSKLEYEITRNMWLTGRNNASLFEVDVEEKNFDEQFSSLVEQEVDRRLFQEKVLKAESDFHEKEILRIQKERELDEIRRQHEKEIYLLKKKLHEAQSSNSTPNSPRGSEVMPLQITAMIPRFHLSKHNGGHVVYEVEIQTEDATWRVERRFRQFRDLHVMMSQIYGGAVHTLSFPARKLFGSTSESLSQERRVQLQTYLNTLIQRCSSVSSCPIYKKPHKTALIEFSNFFSSIDCEGVNNAVVSQTAVISTPPAE